MERRIKFIHALTIGVIVAFALSQGYWLLSRYRLALQEREDALFAAIVAAADEDVELRSRRPQKQVPQVMTQRYYTYTQTTKLSRTDSAATLNLIIAFGEPEEKIIESFGQSEHKTDLGTLSVDHFKADSTQTFSFTLNDADHIDGNLIDRAMKLFQVNMQNPFTTKVLDSLLRKRKIVALNIKVDSLADSLLWQPVLQRHTSLLHPRITVTLPFDILQHRVVRVETAIALSPLLHGMAYTLAGSVLLSLLLVFCLTYQIQTIRKQRRVEELRREFVDTMIHELKRPISTLKMCVSFMGNERMMQDEESKQKILSSSYNELDNLTSYFSKLRDITFNDSTEIPLVKSCFALRGLMEECISKQNIPSDKEVRMEIVAEDDLEIRADRMHLANIVCNLLENAIKYSREAVTIRIDYRKREDGMVQFTVADNGIGIEKADQRYVFDKFYRSESAKDKAIPGIGIGLSYVKLLVEAHGGNISFDSTEGEGTTFTIVIPQRDGED